MQPTASGMPGPFPTATRAPPPRRRDVGVLLLVTLLAPSLWLAGCGAAPPAGMRRVQGSVMLPDRTPLEPGTLVLIRLQDVSRADAPAVLLAERRIEAGDYRQVPFVFDFGIAPERIDPRGRYSVGAGGAGGAVALCQRHGVPGVDARCERFDAAAVATDLAAVARRLVAKIRRSRG